MAPLSSFQRVFFSCLDILADDDHLEFCVRRMQDLHALVMSHMRRQVPRVCGYRDIVDEMTGDYDDYFRAHYRVSRHVFEVLLEFIGPMISSRYVGGFAPVAADRQLLVFLCYLSNQESMREVSQLFGMSPSTVHGIVLKVADALLNLQNRIVRWPDEQRRQEISLAIQHASGLPGIVGFLDGTHIRLSSAPGGDRDYYNRKGFPSMQLQLVVDQELTIISAYTGWPGCCHDARVLRNSALFHQAENGQLFTEGQHILADSAYPLRNWIITPFRNVGNLTNQQRRFNAIFSGQRQTVERAIGHLKGRFRRLKEVPLHNPVDICKLIIAGVICHNVCVMCEDDVETFIDNAGPGHPNGHQNIYQNGYHGVARRMHLLQQI